MRGERGFVRGERRSYEKGQLGTRVDVRRVKRVE